MGLKGNKNGPGYLAQAAGSRSYAGCYCQSPTGRAYILYPPGGKSKNKLPTPLFFGECDPYYLFSCSNHSPGWGSLGPSQPHKRREVLEKKLVSKLAVPFTAHCVAASISGHSPTATETRRNGQASNKYLATLANASNCADIDAASTAENRPARQPLTQPGVFIFGW